MMKMQISLIRRGPCEKCSQIRLLLVEALASYASLLTVNPLKMRRDIGAEDLHGQFRSA